MGCGAKVDGVGRVLKLLLLQSVEDTIDAVDGLGIASTEFDIAIFGLIILPVRGK